MKDEELKSALIKKALGFTTEEVVEEYQDADDELRLVKRKVTTKDVPPDITAIKMLLDETVALEDMTDEQLESEKLRLLNLLKEYEKGVNNEKETK